jgi:hypothetical protein
VSTKYGGSATKQDPENQTQVSEIESRFTKKKRNLKFGQFSKLYKDEDETGTNYLEDSLDMRKNPQHSNLKTKKEDIRQLEEFISTKRPIDPFKDLDPLTQKVDISTGLKYQCTSQNDVLQNRLAEMDLKQPLTENKFLQLPIEMRVDEDPDFVGIKAMTKKFEAYQQKVVYQGREDSSDPGSEEGSDNEDLI